MSVYMTPETRKKNKTSKFSLVYKDETLAELVKKTDKKTLAVWAIDCVERILPFFEEKYPKDNRPRKLVNTPEADTHRVFKMADVRKASLDSRSRP